jgi:anthranilate synthase component 1
VLGYLGYDVVREVEHLPHVPTDDLGHADAVVSVIGQLAAYDHWRQRVVLIDNVVVPDGASDARLDGLYDAAVARLAELAADGARPIDELLVEPPNADDPLPDVRSTMGPELYGRAVEVAREHILAGDIFQVVLAQRFSAPFTLPPFALYRALRRTNPSPYLFHLDFGGFALVGSSPEILVRVRDGEVTIRPIAGTAPRGADEAEDQALAAALLKDPKERAEHLMLLDLGRNDVGRVAEIGSVDVTARFYIERYSHVMHIVSNVIGRLAKTHDAVDALMAGFPAGTVSGAPKVRAMEIIDELEKSKRGPYAGCVGYFSASGQMDTCIVLRTALVKDGVMHVQAGAGLVHDSVPAKEQQECINKAQALFRAAEEAVRFATRAK